MSSGDFARIKCRNRKFAVDLKKSISRLNHSQSLTQMPICCETNQSKSKTEKESLVEACCRQNIKTMERSSRISLSSCYRPSTPRKLNGSTHHRRMTDNNVSTPKTQQSNSSGNKSHLSVNPSYGRLSQLADCVNLLVLQDSSSEFSQKSSSPMSQRNLSGSDTLSPLASSLNPTPSDKRDVQKSPWYRHCRPSAPEPRNSSDSVPLLRLDECSLSPHSKPFIDRMKCEYSDSFCSLAVHDSYILPSVINGHPDICEHLPAGEIGFSPLEFDVDRENWCCLEFPLPPPPLLCEFERHSPELTSHRLPSPPPFIRDPPVESIQRSRQDSVVKAAHSLGPLAPITNLMSASEIWGNRLPKWSVEHEASMVMSDPSRQLSFLRDSYPELHTQSMPSPPPRIVERVPRLASPTRSATELSSPGPCVSVLVRPTVLKRGAPDGAEQKLEESDPIKLVGNLLLSTTSKRCSSTEVLTLDYSPKKIRTHLLLPSEHSAFLPVVSAHSMPHQPVPSPCIL